MNKIKKDKKNEKTIVKEYLKRILRLYIAWSIIYLPITIYHLITSENKSIIISIVRIIKNYIFVGQQFYSWPLWYLLCVAYSLLFMLILKKIRANNKSVFVFSIIFYILGIVYSLIMSNIDSYTGLTLEVLKGLDFLIGSDSRMFQGMFYINLGMIFSLKYDCLKKVKKIYYLLSTIVLLIVAVFFMNEITKVLFNVLLFLTILLVELKDSNVYPYFRKASTVLYFVHMIFFFIYSLIVGFDNCNGIFGFAVTLISSSLFVVVINYINRDKKIGFLNYIFN